MGQAFSTSEKRVRVACAAALLSLAAPAAAQEWFDSYERGLLALKQGRGGQAVTQLERAVRLRPDPGTNLITYGTNRIEKYHPYLRLAEAYLLVGDLGAARETLRRSELRGKEPATERAKLAQQLEALAAKAAPAQKLAAAGTPVPSPPPATTALPPPAPATPAPPAPAPAATPSVAASASPAAPSAAPTLPSGRAPAGARASQTRVAVPPASLPAASPSASVEDRAASLVVYSEPPGAAVYLDDELLGSTDPGSGRLVKSNLAAGSHRVRLERVGYSHAERSVQLAAGGPATLRAELQRLPNPSSVPLVLGGLAAVLAIGALTYLATRRRATVVAEAAEAHTRTLRTPTPASSPTPRRTAVPATPRPTSVSPRTEARQVEDQETQARPPPATAAGAGETFGAYLLREQLGKGGMAAVFRAERGGESCALKRPLTGFLEDPEFRERFLREAEIGRTLHHPNIIRIFERGDVERVPYFTMELVGGETLQQRLRRLGPFEARAAARVIAQVAEALDYAHLKGVIHRDLKPSNIMILEDGAVKVMDYGIARARRYEAEGLTVTGAFLGTPDYVAPETAEGRGTDARSDLYSLGVIFYEILTGKKPFVGQTPFETLQKHCSEPPTPPSVIAPGCPRELEAVILKLLNKDPNQRFTSAEELLIELRDYLNRAR